MEVRWNPAVLEQRTAGSAVSRHRPIDMHKLVTLSRGSRSAPVLHPLFDGTIDEVTVERARGLLSPVESIRRAGDYPLRRPPEGVNVS